PGARQFKVEMARGVPAGQYHVGGAACGDTLAGMRQPAFRQDLAEVCRIGVNMGRIHGNLLLGAAWEPAGGYNLLRLAAKGRRPAAMPANPGMRARRRPVTRRSRSCICDIPPAATWWRFWNWVRSS